MNEKERNPNSEEREDSRPTITLQDLQALHKKGQINLETSDYETYTDVHVSRGNRMSRYQWRKFTKCLCEIGFVHVGGGNPWYAWIKEGTWRGPPYGDEPLGIAIEESDDRGEID